MDVMRLHLALFKRIAFVICAVFWLFGCGESDGPDAIRIVLMQDSAAPFNVVTPAKLAQDTVNAAGGIDGKPIQIEFIRQADTETAYLLQAKAVAEDPNIAAMIYTGGSASFQKMSSIFVDNEKPIISSTSTASSIPRIYADDGFVWRTTESDISQVKALMTIVARDFGGGRINGNGGRDSDGEPLPLSVEDFFEFTLDDESMESETVQEVDCPKDIDEISENCRGFRYASNGSRYAKGAWQHPTPGLAIDSNAEEVTFKAWGQTGGESVVFQVGLPGADSFSRTIEVQLTPEPRTYSIPLYGSEYNTIVGGFGWSVFAPDGGGEVSFFVDDIRWTSDGIQPKVALLTNYDAYSDTFFDWSGFYAYELGLKVTDLARYSLVDSLKGGTEDACIPALNKALSGQPDALIIAIGPLADNACVVRNVFERKEAGEEVPRLLFADAGQRSELKTLLKPKAFELMEGLSLAWGVETNFSQAYLDRTGEIPGQYSANTYDAVLLISYGLAQAGGRLGPALDKAMRMVVAGRGESTGWDERGVKRALEAIIAGQNPDVSGATGSLSYDSEFYTDLVSSTYARWVVSDGEFMIEEFIKTTDDDSGTELVAAFRQLASADRLSEPRAFRATDPSVADVAEHKGNWALIVAASAGWDNYRHQADAFALYQQLKTRGFDDERIILIVADDLADNEKNQEKGFIVNVVDGPNLYEKASIDYRLSEVSPSILMNILAGNREGLKEAGLSDDKPVVDSNESDNLYVFLVGHGGKQGLALEAKSVEQGLDGGQGIQFLEPVLVASTLQTLSENRRYRRALLVVEACHGGVFGTAVAERRIPRTLVLTGQAPKKRPALVISTEIQVYGWRTNLLLRSLESSLRKRHWASPWRICIPSCMSGYPAPMCSSITCAGLEMWQASLSMNLSVRLSKLNST